MKERKLLKAFLLLVCATMTGPVMAQFNLKKAISGAAKVTQAVTLTDEQMAAYVKEYIDWMDTHNQVCADDNEYTIRLKKLTEGLGDAEGIPLNFKVYYVTDVNAFACADGSVRVFSSLMDIMTDEELLGVIGHEVGHVAHRDSKKGFRTALLTSALKDGIFTKAGRTGSIIQQDYFIIVQIRVSDILTGEPVRIFFRKPAIEFFQELLNILSVTLMQTSEVRQ